MNNIIKFPNKNKRKKITDVLVDRLTDGHNHVDLGRVPFTCAECEVAVSFDFTNAIFKDISFYCAGCGHGYRLTNPMFATGLRMVKNSTR
jgi:hypothetical protein